MNLFRGRQLKNIKLILLIFIACLNLRMSIQSIPPVINLIQDDLNLSNVQSSFLRFCCKVKNYIIFILKNEK